MSEEFTMSGSPETSQLKSPSHRVSLAIHRKKIQLSEEAIRIQLLLAQLKNRLHLHTICNAMMQYLACTFVQEKKHLLTGFYLSHKDHLTSKLYFVQNSSRTTLSYIYFNFFIFLGSPFQIFTLSSWVSMSILSYCHRTTVQKSQLASFNFGMLN